MKHLMTALTGFFLTLTLNLTLWHPVIAQGNEPHNHPTSSLEDTAPEQTLSPISTEVLNSKQLFLPLISQNRQLSTQPTLLIPEPQSGKAFPQPSLEVGSPEIGARLIEQEKAKRLLISPSTIFIQPGEVRWLGVWVEDEEGNRYAADPSYIDLLAFGPNSYQVSWDGPGRIRVEAPTVQTQDYLYVNVRRKNLKEGDVLYNSISAIRLIQPKTQTFLVNEQWIGYPTNYELDSATLSARVNLFTPAEWTRAFSLEYSEQSLYAFPVLIQENVLANIQIGQIIAGGGEALFYGRLREVVAQRNGYALLSVEEALPWEVFELPEELTSDFEKLTHAGIIPFDTGRMTSYAFSHEAENEVQGANISGKDNKCQGKLPTIRLKTINAQKIEVGFNFVYECTATYNTLEFKFSPQLGMFPITIDGFSISPKKGVSGTINMPIEVTFPAQINHKDDVLKKLDENRQRIPFPLAPGLVDFFIDFGFPVVGATPNVKFKTIMLKEYQAEANIPLLSASIAFKTNLKVDFAQIGRDNSKILNIGPIISNFNLSFLGTAQRNSNLGKTSFGISILPLDVGAGVSVVDFGRYKVILDLLGINVGSDGASIRAGFNPVGMDTTFSFTKREYALYDSVNKFNPNGVPSQEISSAGEAKNYSKLSIGIGGLLVKLFQQIALNFEPSIEFTFPWSEKPAQFAIMPHYGQNLRYDHERKILSTDYFRPDKIILHKNIEVYRLNHVKEWAKQPLLSVLPEPIATVKPVHSSSKTQFSVQVSPPSNCENLEKDDPARYVVVIGDSVVQIKFPLIPPIELPIGWNYAGMKDVCGEDEDNYIPDQIPPIKGNVGKGATFTLPPTPSLIAFTDRGTISGGTITYACPQPGAYKETITWKYKDAVVAQRDVWISCDNPSSPPVAWGDPHITTLDLAAYDFQGQGEFWGIKHESIPLQVQHILWSDSSSFVTIVSAVATKIANLPIEVRMDNCADVRVLFDGEDVTEFLPAPGVINLEKAAVLRFNPDEIHIVLPPDEEQMTGAVIKIDRKLCTVYTNIPQHLRGQLRGLYGNFDGDPNNDLITRDGRQLTNNISLSTLYHDFGRSWEVYPQERYFSGIAPQFIYPAAPPVTYPNPQAEHACSSIVDPVLRDACILDSINFGTPDMVAQMILQIEQALSGTPLEALGKQSQIQFSPNSLALNESQRGSISIQNLSSETISYTLKLHGDDESRLRLNGVELRNGFSSAPLTLNPNSTLNLEIEPICPKNLTADQQSYFIIQAIEEGAVNSKAALVDMTCRASGFELELTDWSGDVWGDYITGKANNAFTLLPINNFSGTVTIDLETADGEQAPEGITLSPTSIVIENLLPVRVPLSVHFSSAVGEGSYRLRVRVKSGDVEHYAYFNLRLLAPSSQEMLSPQSLAMLISGRGFALEDIEWYSDHFIALTNYYLMASRDGKEWTIFKTNADTGFRNEDFACGDTAGCLVLASRRDPGNYSYGQATQHYIGSQSYFRYHQVDYEPNADKIIFVRNSEGTWNYYTVDRNYFWSLKYLNGRYFGIGPQGIAISEDGYNWSFIDTTLLTPTQMFVIPDTQSAYDRLSWWRPTDIAYGNGAYVIVGYGYAANRGMHVPAFLSTTDFTQWNNGFIVSYPPIQYATDAMRNVVYAGGMFIATSLHGRLYTSLDGIHWTRRSLPTGLSMIPSSLDLLAPATPGTFAVAYGEGRYVVSEANGSQARICSTSDWNSWTCHDTTYISSDMYYTHHHAAPASHIIYTLDGFYAFHRDFTAIAHSLDGNSWGNFRYRPQFCPVNAATYSNNRWIGLYCGATLLIDFNSASITVTINKNTPPDRYWWRVHDVSCRRENCVAVGNEKLILTSSDGKNWVKHNAPVGDNLLRIFAPDDNRWVAIGQNYILVSDNGGETWQSIGPRFDTNIVDATYGNGVWIIVDKNGQVLYSFNLSNWIAHPYFAGKSVSDVVYGDNRFMLRSSITNQMWIVFSSNIQSPFNVPPPMDIVSSILIYFNNTWLTLPLPSNNNHRNSLTVYRIVPGTVSQWEELKIDVQSKLSYYYPTIEERLRSRLLQMNEIPTTRGIAFWKQIIEILDLSSINRR